MVTPMTHPHRARMQMKAMMREMRMSYRRSTKSWISMTPPLAGEFLYKTVAQ